MSQTSVVVLHSLTYVSPDFSTRRPKRGPHFATMKRLLTLLVDHPSSWAFANPVNAAEVTDYYDVIKEPMGEHWQSQLCTAVMAY